MREYTTEEKAYITKQMLRDIIENPDNCLAIKDTFYIENLLKKKRGVLSKGDKVYPTDTFYHYLYGSVLETDIEWNGKYKDILLPLLEEALLEHGMTQEDWKEIKDCRLSAKWFKSVVDAYEKHPMQVELLKDPDTTKKDLYSQGTVNQNARKVIKVRRSKARKNSLEDRVRILEEVVETLKDLPNRVDVLEYNLDEIRNEDYRKIAYLHTKGLPTGDIMKITGFNKMKVNRGINAFKRLNKEE